MTDDEFASYVELAARRVAEKTGYECTVEVGLVARTKASAGDDNAEAEETAVAIVQDAWDEWCAG
jgi:hypothetical protein